jgi:hypothetical protein
VIYMNLPTHRGFFTRKSVRRLAARVRFKTGIFVHYVGTATRGGFGIEVLISQQYWRRFPSWRSGVGFHFAEQKAAHPADVTAGVSMSGSPGMPPVITALEAGNYSLFHTGS